MITIEMGRSRSRRIGSGVGIMCFLQSFISVAIERNRMERMEDDDNVREGLEKPWKLLEVSRLIGESTIPIISICRG